MAMHSIMGCQTKKSQASETPKLCHKNNLGRNKHDSSRLILVDRDKLSPVIKHGFLRSEENVFPVICEHPQGVWENVFLYNFQYLCMVGVITIHVGRFYCLEDVNTLNIVADVIALADVIAMFYVLFLYLRQML